MSVLITRDAVTLNYRVQNTIKETHYGVLKDIVLREVMCTEQELYFHFQIHDYNCLDLFDALLCLNGPELYNNLLFSNDGNFMWPF